MFKIVLFLLSLGVVCSSRTSVPTVSASIKDTSVNGVEGLNLNVMIPYQFQDYLFGLKYTVGDLRKLPDQLFARKSFDTPLEGKVTFDTELSVEDKRLGLNVEWDSEALDLRASASVDNIDRLKSVSVAKWFDFDGKGLKLKTKYDVLKNKVCGSVRVNNDKVSVKVSGDSIARDPVLSVKYKIDDSHTIKPAISLRTGAQTYGFSRKWLGGSASADVTLGDNVRVSWNDEGCNGMWTTSAEVPLKEGQKPKISFSRDWVY